MGSIKPLPTLKNANRGGFGAYTRPKTTPILSSVHQTVNLVLLGNEPGGKIRQLHFPALYSRLSRDDESIGDSLSIQNQKAMLEKYAAQNGFSNIAHFSDDGFSGGNFNRPDWKRLIEEIEKGNVGTVISKDMSRIGRDYLQTGFYTEVFFREKGVRFIAISNNIDSQNRESGEFAPFLNIMSEWYLRDASRKVKASHKARGMSGKRLTFKAIYGYMPDPQDKEKWIIDTEAAEIVKRIFDLTIEGKGPTQIARILHDEKVERPSYYLYQKGIVNYADSYDHSHPYAWSTNTIAHIIERPEYMGHTMNFRTYKDSYKDKQAKENPKENWVIFENTHAAIIDPETWETAQRCRKTVRRTDHAHIMLTMRPIEQGGAWGAKQKKEYILDKNGNKIYDPKKRQYKCKSIPATDWNEQTKSEDWRAAWAEICNRALEQNGHAERIDHRSYARQGIDQIPTVHLGVAASAMEKRGIRTERGNLNREIEVSNQRLRQLKARISKLQNWLKEETENTEPPTLADYIQDILRRKAQAGKAQYSQSLYNLKDAANMLNFLTANNIMDMAGLDEKFSSMIGEQMDIRDKLKPIERRLPVLKKHMEQADIYLKYKGKKALNESEQILFTAAGNYLKSVMNGETTLPTKAWKAEYSKLTAERNRLNQRYVALKDEVKEAEQIRKSVYSILRQEQQPRREQETER